MDKTILYMIDPKVYDAKIIKILRKNKGHTTIYVATTKDSRQLKTKFKRNKLDISRFFFIDCVSKQLYGDIGDAKNTLFTSNPGSLTEISLTITEAVKRLPGKKLLVLDSLSSLLIYNSTILVSKFSNFLINNLRAHQISGIFIVLDSDAATGFVAMIGAACDEIRKG